MPLTPQQETAVYDRGGSLLVSAAAGSGKTKVLVERLFSYMEQEGCQVDDFLIITYTKAAAAELRGKIAQELTRRVADRPGDSHLRRQMLRVYQADIKTVDAFCAGLLRENVHLLPPVEEHSLTPDFRVLDEQEAMLLRRRVLDRVLEDFYAHIEEDGNARQLAETLGAGRDDRALEALVLDLHEKTQSHPHPLRWLEQLRQGWEVTPQELADTGCGRYLMEDALRRADFWARRLTRAVEDMADYPAVYKAYGDRFLEVAQGLEALRDKAAGGWDSLAQGVPSFRRMGVAKGEENAACRERAKAVLEQAKKALKDIQAIFSVPEAELLEDLRQMAPAMLALLRLTAQFTLHYQAEKVRRNVMDFSDQEHYAIDLLTDGQGRPTELAKQVSSRYREVMVDEYQDSNQVQNCIFRALSGEERRLFAVGDVKQSIYRFRLADPTIFLEKYLSYRPAAEAEEGQPRKVLLSRNFRSRREVLDGTNFVFRAIMSREMGEMDYDDDEQLYFGAEAAYPPRPGHGAGAAPDQRGEYGGGNLRPHGGGGPVCGPAHPPIAGPGLPGAGRGRTAPACGAGGYRHSHAVPPGASGGLYGGPAAGEHSLHQRGERGVFQHPGGGGDGVVFADHRQSAAGCAADRRAAVAAVRLFPGPAGPDPGAAAGGRLL